jgi:hypothetical protein
MRSYHVFGAQLSLRGNARQHPPQTSNSQERAFIIIVMYRNRTFVSPLLKRPLYSEGSGPEMSLEKKARLNVAKPLHDPVSNDAARTPLLNLQVPNYSITGREPRKEAYFNVLWRNPTTKKYKTWDGDGVMSLEEGFLTLRDSDGKKYYCRIA